MTLHLDLIFISDRTNFSNSLLLFFDYLDYFIRSTCVCATVLLWLRYLYTGTGVSVAQKADVVEERESETQPGPTFSIVFSQGYVNLHLFDI